MKKPFAIYTTLFGGRDELKEPPTAALEKCDFICFTDNPLLTSASYSIRVVKGLDKDPVRSAKIYKMFPHIYLPEYKYSLWVDANFTIKNIDVSEFISQLGGFDMAIYAHENRKCIYAEADACIQQKKDDPAIITAQIERYVKEKYPKNNGLVFAGIILRRNFSPKLIKFEEAWWEEIKKHSRRDQLSFNYIAWKQKFNFKILDGPFSDNRYFRINDHAK